jgi:hypothetical protein
VPTLSERHMIQYEQAEDGDKIKKHPKLKYDTVIAFKNVFEEICNTIRLIITNDQNN